MDLLLSRYNDMSFVMNLEVDDFLGLINTAIENRRDEEFFAVWKGLVPSMNKDTFVSFEDYKSQIVRSNGGSKPIVDNSRNMTDEEAIADAESVLDMLRA